MKSGFAITQSTKIADCYLKSRSKWQNKSAEKTFYHSTKIMFSLYSWGIALFPYCHFGHFSALVSALGPSPVTYWSGSQFCIFTGHTKIDDDCKYKVFIYLFIYLLGANQKEHTCQMVCKEMGDQYNVERVYVLHKILLEPLNTLQRKFLGNLIRKNIQSFRQKIFERKRTNLFILGRERKSVRARAGLPRESRIKISWPNWLEIGS